MKVTRGGIIWSGHSLLGSVFKIRSEVSPGKYESFKIKQVGGEKNVKNSEEQ